MTGDSPAQGLAPPPQAGRYALIYADPPWTFSTWSERGKGRSAEAHYDCLGLDDIKALPVASWAAADAVLLLWATDPLLPRALEVMAAWGFTYKTVGFYWTKLNRHADLQAQGKRAFFRGMGFWTRANPELCLLGTRGHPRRRSTAVEKLVVAPRREHSRKPDEVQDRIQTLCAGPYLELFARASRPGWDGWGREYGLFDRGSVATRRRRSRSEPAPADDQPELEI
jgi:N6-adenosine-specific RNA methylase IME4